MVPCRWSSKGPRWIFGYAKRVSAMLSAYAQSIVDFLQRLDPADYRAERLRIMERRHELFLEDGRDARALLQRIRTL